MPTIAQPISLRRPAPRRIAASPKLVVAIVVGAGLLALALAKSGPLLDALKRAAEADRRWVVAAVGLEVLSIAGYVLLLHHVVTRATPGLGWRHSYSLSVGGTAASRLLPTAGLGGVALSVVVMRRTGLKTAAIAERLLAFLLLLYSVFIGALLILAATLATGALPAHGPRLIAAGAALGAALVGIALLAALRHPTFVGRIVPRARPHLGVLDAAARRAAGHLRRPHVALAGAPAWWGFDVAELWSMLHAFGAAPLFACGTIAPTHGTAVQTATPIEALFGSRAMMLKVMKAFQSVSHSVSQFVGRSRLSVSAASRRSMRSTTPRTDCTRTSSPGRGSA